MTEQIDGRVTRRLHELDQIGGQLGDRVTRQIMRLGRSAMATVIQCDDLSIVRERFDVQ